MDLIKEIILTLSETDKKEFEAFLSRKRRLSKRKDVEVFSELYTFYHLKGDRKIERSGNQNYHAIRKRLSKELTQFLILKKSISEQKEHRREAVILMVLYFIERKKHHLAWELLVKEEKKAELINNIDLNLKIQRLKLSILPYFRQEKFSDIKAKMLSLQKKQAKIDELQLYFIQIKQDLKQKIAEGSMDSPNDLITDALAQYDNLKNEYENPNIHLKVIEIIRAEYILNRKFMVFADVVQKYYKEFKENITEDTFDDPCAQIEYIMSYTYLNTRNFDRSLHHLKLLKKLMDKDELVRGNFQGKYIAIQSFIQVFDSNIIKAIESVEKFLEEEGGKVPIQENLNLSLNLSAYLITIEEYSKAMKILNFMSKSDSFYQREMGREWLIRKEMIFAIAQVALGNPEMSLKVMHRIEKNHEHMLSRDQYKMVMPFINAIKKYVENPLDKNEKFLVKLEDDISLNKKKVFRDPRLIIFYAWLKAQYSRQKTYVILLEEFNNLD